MKHGRKPTRAQKIKLRSLRLDPLSWLIVMDSQGFFTVEHRVSGATRTLVNVR